MYKIELVSHLNLSLVIALALVVALALPLALVVALVLALVVALALLVFGEQALWMSINDAGLSNASRNIFYARDSIEARW